MHRLFPMLAVLALGLALSPAPLTAQTPTPPGPTTKPSAEQGEASAPPAQPSFPTLLADLDDPDWPTRQTATERLMTDPTITQEDLAAVLRDFPLTLEARHRLDRALRHRIVAGFLEEFTKPGDPGSLGITHPRVAVDVLPDHADPEIVVMSALPGFPAYPTLRPGDIMVRFDRQPFPQPDQPDQPSPVRDAIRRHHAGQSVVIHLVRAGQTLEVNLTLASSNALKVVYEGGPPTQLKPLYHQRLEERLEQLRQPRQPDISLPKPKAEQREAPE